MKSMEEEGNYDNVWSHKLNGDPKCLKQGNSNSKWTESNPNEENGEKKKLRSPMRWYHDKIGKNVLELARVLQ